MTAVKLEVISRNSRVTSLIRGVVASKFSREAVFNFRALSRVSLTVILAELKVNPKKVISCVGIMIDFLRCTTNPRLSNKLSIIT